MPATVCMTIRNRLMARTPMAFKEPPISLVEKLVVLALGFEIPEVPPRLFGNRFLRFWRLGTDGTDVPMPLNEGAVCGNRFFRKLTGLTDGRSGKDGAAEFVVYAKAEPLMMSAKNIITLIGVANFFIIVKLDNPPLLYYNTKRVACQKRYPQVVST
jgi:hypothetical protein